MADSTAVVCRIFRSRARFERQGHLDRAPPRCPSGKGAREPRNGRSVLAEDLSAEQTDREAILAEGERVSVRGVARWEPGSEPSTQIAGCRRPDLRLHVVPPGGSHGPTLISDDPRTLL